jgi:hypothetical protein
MLVLARLRHVDRRAGTSSLILESVHSPTLLSRDIGVGHLYVCVSWGTCGSRMSLARMGTNRAGHMVAVIPSCISAKLVTDCEAA